MHRRCRTAVYLGLFSIAASVRAVLGGQHFEYDEDLGKLAVIYSSAAYDRVEEWVFANPACNEQTKGFVFIESFVGEHTDAFGFVGVDTVGERIVVAFKGTTDVQDWVTNLRTWIHYNHRCAPAGGPNSTTTNTYPGGEAVAPDQRAAETSQSRSHQQQHGRGPGGQQGDLRRQESKQASGDGGGGGGGGGQGWADGGPAESGAAPRFWGREPFPGAGIVGAEDNNNNNNNNPGSSPGVGGRDPAAAAAAGYASSSLEKEKREHDDASRGEGSGAGEDDDGLLIGNVHFGFCEFYQTLVAEGLADKVMHLSRHHPTYTIFVTGHSLGGAAAAVCAADLVERLGVLSERVVLYTLGEPRAGDGIFADGLNEHVGTAYRIVHDKDLVPHLSLCCHGWLGKCRGGEETCPYQHSTEIVYANDMSDGSPWIECDDTVGEDYACDPQGWDLSIADHVHYFARVVGQYCNTPPEDLKPFPLAQEEEKAKWAPYEAAMRQEDDAYRPMERLRDA